MTTLELTQRKNVRGLLIALANGEVRLYNGKYLISSLQVDDPVVWFFSGGAVSCFHASRNLLEYVVYHSSQVSRVSTHDTSFLFVSGASIIMLCDTSSFSARPSYHSS
jgi:hypothetical protein